MLVIAILLKPENKNKTEKAKVGKIYYNSKILFLTISVRIIGLCEKKYDDVRMIKNKNLV